MDHRTYLSLRPHDTVVGYQYKGLTYCRGCMEEIVSNWEDLPASLRNKVSKLSAEYALDLAAQFLGYDRSDEESFDQEEFPVKITDLQACQDGCDFCECGSKICE